MMYEPCSEDKIVPDVKLDDDGNPIVEKKIVVPPVKDDVVLTQEQIDAKIQEGIDAGLAKNKEQLDSAYSARDKALEKAERLKKEKEDVDIQRLKDAGKHAEAHEAELAQERAKNALLEKRNTELTRDNVVNGALGAFEFKSKKARDFAFKDITDSLVQDESGTWVHKDGGSIADTVKAFHEDEGNGFCFKVKASKGPNLDKHKKHSSSDKSKSLFAIPQDEVLKLAAEGKLPGQ